MGLCFPLWPALLVICGNVAVSALGFFWNPILWRNWVVWDSYFHWLDVVLKVLIVLCHFICRFSVICLTENNWVMCVGSVLPTWTHISFRWFSWHTFNISVSLVIWVKSVLMRKMVFFRRKIHLRNKRYFKVDLMLMDAFQNLLTINLQEKVNGWNMEICIKVFIIMYSEGQRRVVVMEQNSSKHIKNLQSLSTLSELMKHTSRWRICPWCHKLVPYPV